MKLFLDTANIQEIKEAWSLGIIDGVTTNPTHISKENKKFRELIEEICSIVDGPISVEAVSLKAEEIVREAEELSKISPNIVVKIPAIKEGIKAAKILSEKGIKTNITLVFSPSQALLAGKVGATYVSPFVGRLNDISEEGINLVADIKKIYSNYGFKTQIIVSAIRNPTHVVKAALIGADVATMRFDILMSLFRHPMTDLGLEQFLKDWEKVPK
ncbi:fructose-6-phosphate aldolase [Dictyoglomus turgidum]|uniref:fructose-6-phosphate aldolase n=1 Tax=Dictyoglomus turgidum TaxID=513050 RepID=UPI00235627CC|nr:fructose-6-phosphate aldolase [Dictyoglomus turgidum]